MINLLNNKKSKIIALALTFVFCMSGVANALTDADIAGMSKLLDEGIDGVLYNGGAYDHIPEGSESGWDVTTGDDWETSVDAFYEGRKNIDLGGLQKYVSTSEENISIVEMTAEIDGGISLGCDGLDLGLEALFEFDAGAILKYLPKYIVTKLAAEALAQIYATPLISTVMDGLKAMRNFEMEMKQATCDMRSIETRKDQIKKDAYNKCIDDVGDSGDAAKTCDDPGWLAKSIEKYKNEAKETLSLGSSMSEILGYDGLYDAMGTISGDIPIPGTYRSISADQLLKSFIPDITWGDDGAKEMELPPVITVSDVYRRTEVTINNFYADIYKGVMKAMKKKGYISVKDQSMILEFVQNYKENMVRSGPLSVYGDFDSDNLSSKQDEDSLDYKLIADNYLNNYKVDIDGKRKPFVIGSKTANFDHTTSFSNDVDIESDRYSDFVDSLEPATDLLKYADLCYGKLPRNNGDNYVWKSLYNNTDLLKYITTYDEEGLNGEYDKMISRLSKCKAIRSLDLTLAYKYMNRSPSIGKLYLKSAVSDASYDATRTIINFVKAKLADTANGSKDLLLKKCNSLGVGNMPPTASYVEGGTGQPYNSCKDYADQNQLTDDKKAELKSTVDELEDAFMLVRQRRNRASEDFRNSLLDDLETR